MVLKLYSSMGRKLVAFRPARDRVVKMYTCGPTVWNFAHVGNFRTFVFEDVLRRYLKFKGYKVVQVKNITDVEDKIIRGMKQFSMGRLELASMYEKAFMEDLATLNVERAEFYPRASENIPEMVALIKKLVRKGYAYRAQDGSTYYDISRFRRYGALSGTVVKQLKVGARVAHDSYDKEEASDFALWKAWDPDDGEVFWETDLGKGRPGWHIECSAMSMKYLGPSFDIHTGGMDLKFPHHENEIAQSEAATGKRFVRYWLHSNFLSISGAEMHKSSGNIITLRELLSRGWDPLTVRLFMVSARYRDPIDLNDEALKQADARRKRIQEVADRVASVSKPGRSGKGAREARQALRRFAEAMDDDLNTPAALAAVFGFVKEVNTLADAEQLSAADAEAITASMQSIDGVLGILRKSSGELPERLANLLAEREEARRRKDFATADRIRQELFGEGVEVQDTPSGTTWKRRLVKNEYAQAQKE